MFPWEQNLLQLRKIGLNIYKMTKVLVFFLFSNMDIRIQLTSHKLRIWQIHCTKQTGNSEYCSVTVFLGTQINFYHQSLFWQIRFIGITFRNRNDSKTDMSPKFAPAWVMAHEIWKWEHTAQPLGLPFPGISVGLRLFWATWWVWGTSQ